MENRKIETLHSDILIVGAGLSGLYTALNIDSSRKITIIAKDKLGMSNSNLAQGGIAGELKTSKAALAKHIEDTIVAGVGLYESDAIKELVYDAKENIEFLIQTGVPFDLDENGKILLTREGGHSKRRILHAGGDATGQKIMETLTQFLHHHENIEILEEYMLYDLISQDNTCYGAKTIHNDGTFLNIFANHIVLATGGIGAVYKDSTNSIGATGDGVAAGYRAGVKIVNMEFVQFHPTVFYDLNNQTKGQKFLISEAVRGEGAYLLNVEKKRFMEKYDKRLELAPRDVVSLAITKELYDTWSEYVYIDARHLGKEFLQKRFPTIYQKCLDNGYRMEEDLIPVAPVEHYGIGGIKIDLNGHTSMKNLFANGECSNSGVHGANRLASNSLLECIVFGKKIAENINRIAPTEPTVIPVSMNITTNNFSYHNIREEIRHTMNQYVFIVRTTEGLKMAEKIINRHYNNLVAYPIATIEYYRALNIATVAKLIVSAALKRKESIGCHYRID